MKIGDLVVLDGEGWKEYEDGALYMKIVLIELCDAVMGDNGEPYPAPSFIYDDIIESIFNEWSATVVREG